MSDPKRVRKVTVTSRTYPKRVRTIVLEVTRLEPKVRTIEVKVSPPPGNLQAAHARGLLPALGRGWSTP